MNARSLLISMIAGSLLIITSCGGGGGGSTPTETSHTAVRLSGTLGIATAGKPAARYANRTAGRTGSTPTDSIIVIAVDASGNSITTMTGRSGDFEFDSTDGLTSNTAYALIFIDTSTLEVIGSLVTGSGGAAGMLNLLGNTTLEEILINLSTGDAIIAGTATVDDSTTTVTVTDAGSLDGNGDGIITQDEITAAQVAAVQSGGAAEIETMSVVTFFGEVNTWSLEVDSDSDNNNWTNDACWYLITPPAECLDFDPDNNLLFDMYAQSGEMTLIVPAQVQGPNGNLVNASKRIELNYYNEELPANPDDLNYLAAFQSGYYMAWNDGYAQATQAEINAVTDFWGSSAGDGGWFSPYLDSAMGSAPLVPFSAKMGLWGWSDYRYVDVENKKMIEGEKRKDPDTGLITIEWGGFALPLNLPLNTDVPITETQTEDIYFNNGQETFSITANQVINVKLVTNPDGSPALVTETGNNPVQLPVIQINMETSTLSIVSPSYNIQNATVDLIPAELHQIVDDYASGGCFYIIAKYGVEADDPDQDCSDMTDWQDGFVNQRFGDIEIDSSTGDITAINDRTASFVAANDELDPQDNPIAGLPVTSANGSISFLAESWLEYMHTNARNIDYVFEPFDFNGGGFGENEFWAWVDDPLQGSALTPDPWGTAQSDGHLLEMGVAPGGITINNVHYMATAVGAHFYMDLRVEDSNTNTENSVLPSPVAVTSVVLSADGSDWNTTNPHDTEVAVNMTANITNLLPASGHAAWTDLWQSWEDPNGDGTYELYETSWVSVWLVMDADGFLATTDDQQEFPVDGYRVIGDEIPN